MKITISKETVLKSSILFFTITAFILSALLFTSCSDSEDDEIVVDDEELIEKIESAEKTTVEEASLPSATTSVLNGDLADTYVETIQLATNLGYQVSLISDNLSLEDTKSDVYFSLQGRQLSSKSFKRAKFRSKCFEFVYPIDLIMPDDSSITLNSEDDWSLKKDWYAANPDATERPELVYPVDVTLEDGTVQTLLDSDELATVRSSCKSGKDKRKCFKLVLPVSFTMEDGTVIEVTERSDYKLIREWKKANPDSTVKPAKIFPLDIEYRDGTIATIEDETAYETAKGSCSI